MTDLLRHPLWEADSLGVPLPDHDFGVSVSLPLWRHVIGYEEKDPAVVSKFRAGYPRFCCPPAVSRLFEAAEADLAEDGERALVFPRLIHAERCLAFIARDGFSGRACEWSQEKLGVALFPAAAYDSARRFWRFCGEVVSTRLASHVLGLHPCDVEPHEGQQANAVLRQRLADLAGQEAEDVFLFPSGMAASYAVHRLLTTLRPGLKTVQLDFPYVDVLKLQQMLGSGAHFLPLVDDAEYDALQALLEREPVAGIFCEVPSNPTLRCVNFERLQEILRQTNRVPIVVDDTIATSAHIESSKVADVMTASLTKGFSGVGDVMAGSVILNRASPFYPEFSAFLRQHADHELWRGDASALEQNSRDFAQRARIMSRNALALAEYLRAHPRVERVWHAKEQGGTNYEYLRRPDGGYGCLVSFLLKDAAAASPVFYDSLRLCKGPSLGTNFSIACPYTLLAHYDEIDWTESCGVPRYLIRVSAGLEETEDLLGRFAEALAKATPQG